MRWVFAAALTPALGGCGDGSSRAGSDDLARLRAENALAQGRHDWARLYFREDFEAHPERLDSLREEGLAWSSGYLQSLSTAIERFDQYLVQQPDDGEIRLRLASAHLMLGQTEEAARAAESLPEGPEEDLVRAEALQQQAPAEALAALSKSLAARPDHARARALTAELEELAGRDEVALDNALAAIRLHPLLSGPYYQLARIWRRRGDPGDAEAARESLAAYRRASRLSADGTMAPLPADEALEEAVALEEIFRRRFAPSGAPAIGPLPLPLAQKQVELLFAAGRRAEAVDAARQILARKAAGEPSKPALSLTQRLELAVAAQKAGQQRFAREIFEQILDENPGNRGATASLSLLDLRSGDTAAARARLASGLEDHPSFARYHHLLGLVARSEGREGEADQHLAEAVHLAPWEWPWRETYADLLLARGDREAFRRVVTEAPEETPARSAYQRRHRALLGET